MRHPADRSPHRALLAVALLAALALAGCTSGPTDTDQGNGPGDHGDTTDTDLGNGDDTTDGRALDDRWHDAYDLDPRFDGNAAYRLALEQLYDDPAAKTGPRYRIPGTTTHTQTATWIVETLETTLGEDASVTRQTFTGEAYYALDLHPLPSAWTCDNGQNQDRKEDTDRVRAITFTNVLAQTDPDHLGWVVAAHWDSKRAGHDGQPILAGDDGAGSTAVVLELARAFADAPVDAPISFLLLDGEDGFDDCHPLAGSMYHAKAILAADDTLRSTMHGLILLDMVGNASATFKLEGNSRSYTARDGTTVRGSALQDKVWETAANMGVEAFVDRPTRGVIDDHIPYLEIGIPSIDIIRYDESGFASYWHTTRDDHTSISPVGLEQVGVVVETTLRRLATE